MMRTATDSPGGTIDTDSFDKTTLWGSEMLTSIQSPGEKKTGRGI